VRRQHFFSNSFGPNWDVNLVGSLVIKTVNSIPDQKKSLEPIIYNGFRINTGLPNMLLVLEQLQ
jgi:hypothetical protein